MKFLFTCVVEDGPAWEREAFNVALAIREGDHANSADPVVVQFVEGRSDHIDRDLRSIGVDTRVIPRFDPRTPPCNKLNALDVDLPGDVDALVLLDADTILVDSPISLYDKSRVTACPEFYAQLEHAQWQPILSHFGASVPTADMLMTASNQPSIPYWNAGLVVIPAELSALVSDRWTSIARTTVELLERHQPDRVWFTDQIALAVAAATGALPIGTLPRHVHRMTTTRVKHPSARSGAPILIHYGSGIDDRGFLNASIHQPDLNPRLDAFNRQLASARNLQYSGLPRQPRMDRLIRSVSKSPIFRSSAVSAVRSHPLFAPIKRLWKRAQRQRRGDAQ